MEGEGETERDARQSASCSSWSARVRNAVVALVGEPRRCIFFVARFVGAADSVQHKMTFSVKPFLIFFSPIWYFHLEAVDRGGQVGEHAHDARLPLEGHVRERRFHGDLSVRLFEAAVARGQHVERGHFQPVRDAAVHTPTDIRTTTR